MGSEAEHNKIIVTLRGSMAEIVQCLAQAISAGIVDSIKTVTPCTADEYVLCPLAALVDPDHSAHTHVLEAKRQAMARTTVAENPVQ